MAQSKAEKALYRTVWRWHFYAGIIVAPFMFLLAVTGAIYLFNDEINDVLHGDKRFAVASGPRQPLSRIADVALAAFPGGRVTRIDTPTEPGRTFQVFVTPAVGGPMRVFVDPASGRVLGSYYYPHTLIGISDHLHGSLFMGDIGDAIVEIASCWGLILFVTGTYLWWPRGRISLYRSLWPSSDIQGRRYWKSLHAAVGIWTAALAVFLILSGLPWATVWGGMFRSVTAAVGVGYPASVRAHGAPASTSLTEKEASSGAAPWTLEANPATTSSHHGGHHDAPESRMVAAEPLGLDRIAAIVASTGMTDPYRLSIPANAAGVFSAYTYPDQPEGQRSIYIDQYSGDVIRDVGFKDYGIAAKTVELGVQIHMGNYFGRINQIVMLIPCIGIVVLSVTGPYMWWIRRPKGRFGAPRALSPTTLRTFALITGGMAALFPLAGASLVAVGIIDAVTTRIIAGRRA